MNYQVDSNSTYFFSDFTFLLIVLLLPTSGVGENAISLNIRTHTFFLAPLNKAAISTKIGSSGPISAKRDVVKVLSKNINYSGSQSKNKIVNSLTIYGKSKFLYEYHKLVKCLVFVL